MVIEVEILLRSIPLNSNSISSIVDIGTPTFPTSPSAIIWSESYPICVGKSNAIERPDTPFSIRYLYLLFDSAAEVIPLYCLIDHNLSVYILLYIPLVKGYFPAFLLLSLDNLLLLFSSFIDW